LDYAKIGRVKIGDNVFIGANSIILPDVQIGSNVIVGAGSVVTNDIPDGCLVVGNPARIVGTTGEYLSENRDYMKLRPLYDKGWTIRGGITNEQKDRMAYELQDNIGFVE